MVQQQLLRTFVSPIDIGSGDSDAHVTTCFEVGVLECVVHCLVYFVERLTVVVLRCAFKPRTFE